MPSDSVQALIERMRQEAQEGKDFFIAHLEQSAAWPKEAVVDVSFLITDAALASYLSQDDQAMRSQRRMLSSGSAIYMLRVGKAIVGSFRLRAVANNSTHIALEIDQAIDKVIIGGMEGIQVLYWTGYLIGYLWAFIDHLYKEQIKMEELAKATESFIVAAPDTFSLRLIPTPAMKVIPPSRTVTNEPPEPGDLIDDWLDWRDSEINRGRSKRSVSLPQIAKKSGHPLGTLKRYSAARSKRPK